MEFAAFSPKQMTALTWWCGQSRHRGRDAIICDGAVRSGKTLCLSLSFLFWAFYRFSGQSFAFCGKTIASLRRNVVTPLLGVLPGLGFEARLVLSQNLLELKRGNTNNRIYLFGGRDESSHALIQGVTLAGVLFDEVALMPRSFVEQALARCSVEGSKFWFSCNPEYPQHWFYQEWILKAKEKNALYLHFTMRDNPSLSPTILQRYAALYTGPFYERFVEGRWVAAQGLIYPGAAERAEATPAPVPPFEEYCVSCDYGTVNPSSFGLWARKGGVWYRVGEYYYDSRTEGVARTDEEHYQGLEALCGELPVGRVIVDPSAASFLAVIRRHGRFQAIPAKNDVLDGIRAVSDALKTGEICVCSGCHAAIREFGLYRWEEGGARDCPRKENDHAMDDIRYFVATVLRGEDCGIYAVAAPR